MRGNLKLNTVGFKGLTRPTVDHEKYTGTNRMDGFMGFQIWKWLSISYAPSQEKVAVI